MAEASVKDRVTVARNIELKPIQGLGGTVVGAHPYTKANSHSLGCGLFTMENADWNFQIDYDEIIYVIEDRVACTTGDDRQEAGAGEIMYIPRGGQRRFQTLGRAKFFNVTSVAKDK